MRWDSSHICMYVAMYINIVLIYSVWGEVVYT